MKINSLSNIFNSWSVFIVAFIFVAVLRSFLRTQIQGNLITIHKLIENFKE